MFITVFPNFLEAGISLKFLVPITTSALFSMIGLHTGIISSGLCCPSASNVTIISAFFISAAFIPVSSAAPNPLFITCL